MCMIVAINLPRDPDTGKPSKHAKWVLAKIRDRPYHPTIEIIHKLTSKHGELNGYRDMSTGWAEGIYSNSNNNNNNTLSSVKSGNIALVNSALSNLDKYESLVGVEAKQDKNTKRTRFMHGDHIIEAISTGDVDQAVSVLKNHRLTGHTFVTDGNKLLWLEIYIPLHLMNELEEKIKRENPSMGKGDIALLASCQLTRNKQVVIHCTELSSSSNSSSNSNSSSSNSNSSCSSSNSSGSSSNNSSSNSNSNSNSGIDGETPFHVRNNHTISPGEGGYQMEGFSKISSWRRMEYTQSILKSVFDKKQLIRSFSSLGHPSIDPNPFFRPIRHQDKSVPIFSTMEVIFDVSENQMHIIPVSGSITLQNGEGEGGFQSKPLEIFLNAFQSSKKEKLNEKRVMVHPAIRREVLTEPKPVIQFYRTVKALFLSLICYLLVYFCISSSHELIIVNFWMNECPSLDGLMRIVVYSSLFLVYYCTPDSPLLLVNKLEKLDERFIGAVGLLHLLPNRCFTLYNIKLLSNICFYSWICCILGFAGIFPPFLLGISVLFLHGVKQTTEVFFPSFLKLLLFPTPFPSSFPS